MGSKTGSAGRFGVRYGKTIRTKLFRVEKIQRKKQVCPYCKKPNAKRIATGIFQCNKCESKFTGKAYYV
ncbi:MAG: 50S ribosomal protein L37ae [Nanoarchaeota archaeon]